MQRLAVLSAAVIPGKERIDQNLAAALPGVEYVWGIFREDDAASGPDPAFSAGFSGGGGLTPDARVPLGDVTTALVAATFLRSGAWDEPWADIAGVHDATRRVTIADLLAGQSGLSYAPPWDLERLAGPAVAPCKVEGAVCRVEEESGWAVACVCEALDFAVPGGQTDFQRCSATSAALARVVARETACSCDRGICEPVDGLDV